MMDTLHDNQFATGLIATTVLAALFAYLRNVPHMLWSYGWAQLAVSAEIKNTDPAFNWLSVWLAHQPYSKQTRRLSVYTYHRDKEDEDDISIHDPCEGRRKKSRPRVLFTPSEGEHVFWYKGHLVWLSRSKASQPAANSSATTDREAFHLSVLGRDQTLIRDILNDAMAIALPEDLHETCIIASGEGRWQNALHRKPRPSSSVILDNDLFESLRTDIRHFLANRNWYDGLGIPYRRGYLLHGVPGSGKTSTVLALAGELGLDVYMMNLSDRYIDDGRVSYLLSQVPPGNIVLLEDIDAVFAPTRKVNVVEVDNAPAREATTAVTFSGLLNTLDGVAACEGRLLFMTTNHKEMLDPALIRPGRADMHVEFGNATPQQAVRMFNRFFPATDPALGERFGGFTPKNKVSMATIQDHLLTHKNDPDVAVSEWIQANKAD